MRIIVSFVLLLCVFQTTHAQTQFVALSAYGNLPSKSMFTISPSGEYVAYRDTKDGKDLVVIVNTKDFKMVNAVNVAAVNPNHLYFVDNNKLIMVISNTDRIFGYKGRHKVSYAFSYNIASNELYQMLSPARSDITPGQTNLGNIVGISVDKKFAFMPAYDETYRLNLYRVNLQEQKRARIHQRGSKDTIDFFMGSNDQVIARERYIKSQNKHIVESFLSGEWKVVFEQETDVIRHEFDGITPDKKRLVMSIGNENGQRAYSTLSLEDGSIAEQLFSRADKSAESTITDINRIIYGVEYSGFTPTYEFFDEQLTALIKTIEQALPQLIPRIVDYSDNWKHIIFYADGVDNAGGYILYKPGNLNLLAKARPDIPIDGIANTEKYSYASRDGLKIPTLLTYPKGKKRKNLPAVMMPHGGPASYDKLRFDFMAQYFANRGYLVIQPQFRGSTGFGAIHRILGRGEWARKMQDDLTDGVKHLAENGIIDPAKVCIVGASYGGYAAQVGAVFTPDLYKCVISINGVADISDMITVEKQRYGNDHWVVAYWELIIASGEFDKDHLKQISPVNYVENVKAPILLIHGEHDKVVPWSQSKAMYDALDDAGKDVTLVTLPKGDHYLSKATNRMKAMEAIDTFLLKHM